MQKEIRLKEASFARVSPCTYQWGIEGKEKPWWAALLTSWAALPPVQKLNLLNLTSDVDEEWLAASKIQHKVLTEAYRLMSTADCRRRRSWWASEVNHLVGSHMGWLGKSLSRGVLGKCADGERPKRSLALGEPSNRYIVSDWSAKLRLT